MLTCRDVIDLLLDYLESSLTPEAVAALERHLQACAPCVAYLNTYRSIQQLTGEVARVSMPEDMKVRLRQFLGDRLAEGNS